MNEIFGQKNLSAKYEELMQEVIQDSEVQNFLAEHEDILSQEVIQSSAANLFEFVSEKKKFLNQEDQLVTGHRPRLVLGHRQIEVIYEPTSEFIEYQQQMASRRRFKSLYLPKSVKRVSWDGLYRTPEREEALSGIARVIQEFLDHEESQEMSWINDPAQFVKGLYLFGSFGTGKTYMLSALGNLLANKGYEVIMMHYPTFTGHIKGAIGDNTLQEKISEFKEIPVLILDDIGAETNSAWLRDEVLGVILQHRMQENLPTFFTSNIDMAQMESDHFRYTSRGEDEPLKSARIVERIRYLAEEIEVTGKNYRQDRDS